MHDPTQMAHGERFAIEGLLTVLEPDLALETGTAEGGSLRRLAAHSREVHAFEPTYRAGASPGRASPQ